MSKFQLESIWTATVVWNLAICGVIDHLPAFVYSNILFFQFVLVQGALEHWCETVSLVWAAVFVDEINQLLPVPHICLWCLELFGGYNHILAIQHPVNHNHERCIWQLWEVTYPLFACVLSQIQIRSLVASPHLFPSLSNFACTFLQTHLHPPPGNPFSIIRINWRQPLLECPQKICDRRHPVQGSISNMFELVLPPDNRPLLLLEKLCHPYFLPLVECTVVGLFHPFGKLHQGELRVLQANWGFAFCTAQVRQIVALISCIIFVVGYLQQCGQVGNPSDMSFLRFRWWLGSFVGRHMGCLPSAPDGGWGGGDVLEDIGWLIGWLYVSPGGSLGALGDDGPCPGNCGGGNIWDPP